jgi:hypothetical protein
MNEVEWLKSFDRADLDRPVVDVAASVMQAVRSRSAARNDDRIIPIAAAVAAVLGVVATAIVVPAWSAKPDPFAGFGEVFNLVLR